MSGPLEDVRILDLTQVQAGPSCTQLLAWLGADVIKLEEPVVGDRTRTEMAHTPEMDSFYYLIFNANKRSVCLDLKSENGKAVFERLVGVCDVVIENFGPGGMERFSLGYQRVKAIDPQIIYASIKGFGTYGPYSEYKSFENIAQAMSGAMSTNGQAGGPPQMLSTGVGDSGSGLHCAIGILAALYRRQRTGAGDYVEVSMQDAVVNLNRVRMVQTLGSGEPLARLGNRMFGPPALVYQCRPGGPNDYVSLYIGGEAWDSLLAIIGRAELIGDTRYSTREARAQNSDEIETFLTEWTSRHTKYEVMEALNEVGIPCGAVLDTREVLEDPHLRAREMVVEVDDPQRGTYSAIGCPVKLSSNTVTVTPPPLLGQHSGEVLSELLGIGQKELQDLSESGVI
ncbi:MAG: CoA transferase [SAR202 cluster bacterium]|jgi:formyl-CoA transferase|nr:CoA transferase [SAR202 cluster bacterium]